MEYDATGFLEKNRDRLPVEIIHILRTSENKVVRTLFQTPLSKTGASSIRASSFCLYFSSSLYLHLNPGVLAGEVSVHEYTWLVWPMFHLGVFVIAEHMNFFCTFVSFCWLLFAWSWSICECKTHHQFPHFRAVFVIVYCDVY